MASKVINLTPHTVRLTDGDGNIVAEFPPSGKSVRVSTSAEEVGELMGRPIVRTIFGEVEGLPSPEEGTVYITSTLVAQAARRADVISPDTGPTAIRENGQVVAVRQFQTF